MTSYIIKLLSFTLLLLAACVVFFLFGPSEYISPGLLWIAPFLFFVSLFSQTSLNHYRKKSAQAYVRAYMLVSLMKFLVCVAALLIWAFAGCGPKTPFFISFLILFLAFLMFDLLTTLSVEKKNK
jgi:hypothetical protein